MGIPQNQEIHRVIRNYLQKLPDKNENILWGKGVSELFFYWEVSGFCEYFTNFVVINSYGTMVLSCSHMQIKREI